MPEVTGLIHSYKLAMDSIPKAKLHFIGSQLYFTN